MSKTNIILTGFMGCGKTTVGRILAKKLGYTFIDTDQLIEQRCGMTVHEIFASKGERAFRRMESDIAHELGEGEAMIISTGGGMMVNSENVAALSANGRVFCLVATPEEILQRVSSDNSVKRPLLEVPDPLKKITELTAKREKSYRKFSQISTSNRTPEEISQLLISTFLSP